MLPPCFWASLEPPETVSVTFWPAPFSPSTKMSAIAQRFENPYGVAYLAGECRQRCHLRP